MFFFYIYICVSARACMLEAGAWHRSVGGRRVSLALPLTTTALTSLELISCHMVYLIVSRVIRGVRPPPPLGKSCHNTLMMTLLFVDGADP